GASGAYSTSVPYGWSGTVIPDLPGYTFKPVTKDFSNVTTTQKQDFAATAITFTISGKITTGGAGKIGVVVKGLPGDPITSLTGAYTATVPYNWSGMVTPVLAGYAFTPAVITYANVMANQTQNYEMAAATFTIAGKVMLNGVALSVEDGI
ncbi:MAG: hypothetical protein WCJ57_01885, partial [Candidatus Falkowbacteria bacterium]